MAMGSLAALMLAVAAGAALRLPVLGRKPMHTDEAVQAIKFLDVRETGRYRYDPAEYHGPALAFFTTLGVREVSEASLRRVPAWFCLGLLLLLPGLRDGLGRGETAAAGLLLAVSPILVYYSRYYIHESLFLFFTLGALVCGWRYAVSGRVRWAVLAGAGLGLMHATKETCVISFAALAAALAAAALTGRRRLPAGHLVAGAAAAAGVSILLFSWFFTHLPGPLDSMRTYAPYLERAGGSGHEKPWYYYAVLLGFHRDPSGAIWSEGLILGLGAVGAVGAIRGGRPLPRFLAIYTALVAAGYSAIPYKTPWLAMNIVLGLALLAGTGLVILLRRARHPVLQGAVLAVFVAGAADLARQSYRAGWRYHSDDRNPYAYSPTSPDVVRLTDQIRAIARAHPDGQDMLIKIISPEYWPLPWYLRDFSRVGYWTAVPEDPDAPVILVAPELQEQTDTRLRGTYTAGLAGLRPSVLLVQYTEAGLWADYLDGQP